MRRQFSRSQADRLARKNRAEAAATPRTIFYASAILVMRRLDLFCVPALERLSEARWVLLIRCPPRVPVVSNVKSAKQVFFLAKKLVKGIGSI